MEPITIGLILLGLVGAGTATYYGGKKLAKNVDTRVGNKINSAAKKLADLLKSWGDINEKLIGHIEHKLKMTFSVMLLRLLTVAVMAFYLFMAFPALTAQLQGTLPSGPLKFWSFGTVIIFVIYLL